jgi:hypothetical protein
MNGEGCLDATARRLEARLPRHPAPSYTRSVDVSRVHADQIGTGLSPAVLRLAGLFVQRADLHGIPGLTSALATCVERNTSAPGTGESGARARPRRSGILPCCGPAGQSIVPRSVGPTRLLISSESHPSSPSRDLGPKRPRLRCHFLVAMSD